MHGLGLYIFAGEDLPEPDAITPDEETKMYRLAEAISKELVDDLKVKVSKMEINANNYEACIEKVEQMIKNKKGDK